MKKLTTFIAIFLLVFAAAFAYDNQYPNSQDANNDKVGIFPANPVAGEQLKCTIGNNENENLLSYLWFINNDPVETQTKKILPAGITQDGDAWRCEVELEVVMMDMPSFYFDYGSEEVTIGQGAEQNNAPIFVQVGDKVAYENEVLEFIVTAQDPENDPVQITLETLVAGSSLEGYTFTWVPNMNQGSEDGSFYNLEFEACDNKDACSKMNVKVTVYEESGQETSLPPTITPIGDKTVSEGELLSFQITGTDPNNDIIAYIGENLPVGATLNGNTFNWVPDYAQGNNNPTTYPGITFSVQDSTQYQDSETITISVDNTNRAPTFVDNPLNMWVVEGATLNDNLDAFDPDVVTDGDVLVYNALSALPAGAQLTSNGDVIWTPTETQGDDDPSIYTFNVRVTDSDGEFDTTIVQIFVLDTGTITSELIVTDDIANSYDLQEGQTFTEDFIAIDSNPDNVVAYFAENLPAGATFENGIIAWTPDFTQGNNDPTIYNNILLIVQSISGVEERVITLNVDNTNRAPQLLLAETQFQVCAEETLQFTVNAYDADIATDNQQITLEALGLPADATFANNVFEWTPATAPAIQDVIFVVTDEVAQDQEVVNIVVEDCSIGPNAVPTLDAPQQINGIEAQGIAFNLVGNDNDNDQLTYGAQNAPAGLNVNPTTGEVTWTPSYTQGDEDPTVYSVTFTVTDGFGPLVTAVTVFNIFNFEPLENNEPSLISPENWMGFEGQVIEFDLVGLDPENDPLTYMVSLDGDLPTGMFVNPTTGHVSWNVQFTQGNDNPSEYDVVFAVFDAGKNAMDSTHFTIMNVNRAPEFVPQQILYNIEEGELLQFNLEATDLDIATDGDFLNFYSNNLPSFAKLYTTGQFAFQPDYSQAGTYEVTFYVEDSFGATDAVVITIVVGDVNSPPTFDPESLEAQNAAEGAEFTYQIVATDADGFVVSYAANNLPEGALFDALTGTIAWTPDFTQGNENPAVYEVNLVATDDAGDSNLEVLTINVYNTNRDPVFDPETYDFNITEGDVLEFTLQVTDLDIETDGDILSLDAQDLPEGANFTEDGFFTWTPTYTQGDEDPTAYQILVRVSDLHMAQDDAVININVLNENQPPVVAGNTSFDLFEGEEFLIEISPEDVDGDMVTVEVENLPEGAYYDHGLFLWTPDYTQGDEDPTVYEGFTMIATDSNDLSSETMFTFNVFNTNRAPLLDEIGSHAINELETLTFTLSAVDPDGDAVSYYAVDLPDGASLDQETGLFAWTPSLAQDGIHEIVFGATDLVDEEDRLADEELVTILVYDIASPEYEVLLTASATPENGLSPLEVKFSAEAIGVGDVSYEWDLGDGVITQEQNPMATYTEEGVYYATIIATDSLGKTATETFTINVQPGVTASLWASPTSGKAPLEVEFKSYWNEGEGDFTCRFDLGDGNSRTDCGFKHTYTEAGTYNVLLTVTDGNGNSDTATVTINVYQSEVSNPGKRYDWQQLKVMNTEPLMAGDQLEATITFANHGFDDIKRAKITAYIEGLDSYTRIGPFDVGKGDDVTKHILLDVPHYAEAGTYVLKVIVSDEDQNQKRVKYREFKIQ
jgi:PKD repeat protein